MMTNSTYDWTETHYDHTIRVWANDKHNTRYIHIYSKDWKYLKTVVMYRSYDKQLANDHMTKALEHCQPSKQDVDDYIKN